MKYRKVHLVCFSPTRTSFKVGKAVALGAGADETEVTDMTYQGMEKHPGREDLTVVAVPVYGGRVAETAMERLDAIRGTGGPCIVIVVYGNRDYEDALLELKDWAVSHDFVPVAGAAFIGEHSYSRPGRPIAENRPDSHDLALAGDFGRKVEGMLEAGCMDGGVLEVKGNFPYKVKGAKTPQTPLTREDACTRCGYCIRICPVGCIRLEDGIVSDAEACIKCCACVKGCPQGARIFDTPYTDMLFQRCSEPRTPELFYIKQ